MSFLKYLFILILLNSLFASPQINLYFTDWKTDKQNDVLYEENCLYITVMIEKESNSDQIIRYCMSESIRELNIENNSFNKIFTFDELREQKISSEQLYFWSTPIDIIERYEIFLNEYSISMREEFYYNCTLPRFGPYCQYEFDNYKSDYNSLNEMINDYYLKSKLKSDELTCYIHLECNRGPSPSCLDWSDICDGKIDCLNNGIDEKYCWQLEINECNENEYRCSNGQCIPAIFFRDNHLIPDCLDGSDEIEDDNNEEQFDCSISIPTFACEDVTCTVYRSAKYYQHKTLLTSSCKIERNNFLAESMFSNQSNIQNVDCWLAFKCIIHMPMSQEAQCRQLCQNKYCDKLIENNCPDILFIPDVPVLFGHIYFAYTKNYSKYSDRTDSPPRYICFSKQFCNEILTNEDLFIFNNTICARPHDLSLIFSAGTGRSWLNRYILSTANVFSKCNSIINNDSILCDKPNMYRCLNSSKCISIYRLKDGILDCFYYDDENVINLNNTSLTYLFKTHFKCKETNQYISYRLVKNGQCDCNYYDNGLCEDENFDIDYIKKHISFQTICDGFTELLPISINNENHTDETECEQWICNNIYTHCDGIWHCFNGDDEINCNYSLSMIIKCPLNNHICVSFITNQLICLPIEKSNDGNIDCLGATDEPKLCRSSYSQTKLEIFYCNNNNTIEPCIQHTNLCDGLQECYNNDDERICDINRNDSIYGSICLDRHVSIRNHIENYLCTRFNNDINKQRIVYFSLLFDSTRNSIRENEEKNQNLISSNEMIIINSNEHCHRGISVRIWLDSKFNSSKLICLCPLSYYGNKCEYQNERISLTIQFRSLSDSYQIPFIILIYLIDNSNERLIHSYEQFIYLSKKDCQKKFHNYFIYLNRPKNFFKIYSIHIDIYEKLTLNYRTSFLFPIKFSFLPIYRLSLQLIIPQNNQTIDIYSQDQCINGISRKYFNNNNQTFCQCQNGWTGKYCTIKSKCHCSIDSLCIGKSLNNRSICICPINKFGSRCLLNNSLCQLNKICLNNGQCISYDQTFICICPKGFSGKQCELIDKKIILSFNNNLILSESIFIHFIEIIKNSFPKRSTIFKTILPYDNLVTIYWPHLFNLIFIELFNKTLYLVNIENNSNEIIIINKTIEIFDRCQHINEIFNYSFSQLNLIKRIKYYHLPCQESSLLNLSCFYDDIHICLCDYFNNQRQTNCFEFDHQMKFNCQGQSVCENNAQCLQDNSTCPQTSICICPKCFYGRRCQFNTNGFSLSLDAILGYYIHPLISFKNQPIIFKITFGLTILMTIMGIINGLLLMITLKSKKLHEVGSGIYLLISSIFTIITMILFSLKFFILFKTQIENNLNRSFLNYQCILIDYFLQICFHMDNWLHASVGCERAITAIKATRFNKIKSKKAAKYVIFILLIFMIITLIHDPLHRRLIDDTDEYGENKRIWCIVNYSQHLQIFNSIINIIHFCIPFLINLISTIIIIKSAAQQKATVQPEQTHRQHLHNQFQKHSRLLIAPTLLVILAFPRLIISFASGCMKSINNSWLFITGYFISFIPPIITFFLFIIPSKVYRAEFKKSIKKYQLYIKRLFHCFHSN